MQWHQGPCTAFEGRTRIAAGRLQDVAVAAKTAMDRTLGSAAAQPVLVFDDTSSDIVELDWRGSLDEFRDRLARLALAHAPAPEAAPAEGPEPRPPGDRVDVSASTGDAARGPGRPRLGVVAREVTLLPRHWQWLSRQTGGASVALRKLVETARRASESSDRMDRARAVVYKFISTLMGNAPGFEEAIRALFAGDQAGFEAQTAAWPVDVRMHLKKIAVDVFAASSPQEP